MSFQKRLSFEKLKAHLDSVRTLRDSPLVMKVIPLKT